MPSTPSIPRLETERLILRDHRLADFPSFRELWADPTVVEHITGEPSTEQQSWARFLSYAGHWSHMGFGLWAVEEKATASYVGQIGFAYFKRGLKIIEEQPEAGWVLTPDVHGKGYATEALRAALVWGETNLPSKEVACIINVGNAPSMAVAKKAGFTYLGQSEYQGAIINAYSRHLG